MIRYVFISGNQDVTQDLYDSITSAGRQGLTDFDLGLRYDDLKTLFKEIVARRISAADVGMDYADYGFKDFIKSVHKGTAYFMGRAIKEIGYENEHTRT